MGTDLSGAKITQALHHELPDIHTTHRIGQHESLQFLCRRYFIFHPRTRARYEIRNSFPTIGDGKAFAGLDLPQ